MKILFLSHPFHPDIGGIEINSEILAGEFTKAGHQVRLVTWSKGPATRTFSFEVVRQPGWFQLLKQHLWADVVFENNPCLRLSWPNFFIPRRRVIAVRTDICRNDGRLAWQDRLKRWWLKKAAGVIAVSNATRKNNFDAAVVIGNPFRSGHFTIIPNEERRGFVFFGRLVSYKHADIAITAISKLKARNLPVEHLSLTVIGDGPEMAALRELTSKLNLEQEVKFTGYLEGESLIKELNGHRYLLIPSDGEAFGNVALEGLACGLLPFVSNNGGLPDAVGKAGVTFQVNQVDSLVKEIEKILANPQLEEHYRREAATHLQNHTPEAVAARYLELIEGKNKEAG